MYTPASNPVKLGRIALVSYILKLMGNYHHHHPKVIKLADYATLILLKVGAIKLGYLANGPYRH